MGDDKCGNLLQFLDEASGVMKMILEKPNNAPRRNINPSRYIRHQLMETLNYKTNLEERDSGKRSSKSDGVWSRSNTRYKNHQKQPDKKFNSMSKALIQSRNVEKGQGTSNSGDAPNVSCASTNTASGTKGTSPRTNGQAHSIHEATRRTPILPKRQMNQGLNPQGHQQNIIFDGVSVGQKKKHKCGNTSSVTSIEQKSWRCQPNSRSPNKNGRPWNNKNEERLKIQKECEEALKSCTYTISTVHNEDFLDEGNAYHPGMSYPHSNHPLCNEENTGGMAVEQQATQYGGNVQMNVAETYSWPRAESTFWQGGQECHQQQLLTWPHDQSCVSANELAVSDFGGTDSEGSWNAQSGTTGTFSESSSSDAVVAPVMKSSKGSPETLWLEAYNAKEGQGNGNSDEYGSFEGTGSLIPSTSDRLGDHLAGTTSYILPPDDLLGEDDWMSNINFWSTPLLPKNLPSHVPYSSQSSVLDHDPIMTEKDSTESSTKSNESEGETSLSGGTKAKSVERPGYNSEEILPPSEIFSDSGLGGVEWLLDYLFNSSENESGSSGLGSSQEIDGNNTDSSNPKMSESEGESSSSGFDSSVSSLSASISSDGRSKTSHKCRKGVKSLPSFASVFLSGKTNLDDTASTHSRNKNKKFSDRNDERKEHSESSSSESPSN